MRETAAALTSPIWLVCLPEGSRANIAERLLQSAGLVPLTVGSLNEAILRASEEGPRLAIAGGHLDQTERFRLYRALQPEDASYEAAIMFLDEGEAHPRLDVLGSGSQQVSGTVTVDQIANLVRKALVPTAPAIAEDRALFGAPADAPSLPSAAPNPMSVAGQLETSTKPATQSDSADLGAASQEPHAIEQVLAALTRRLKLAALVFAAVMLAVGLFTSTREKTYLARASLIISPSANVDRGSLVYSVDSLGRGRIVGTYAEVLGSELVHREALERLGKPASALGQTVTFKSSTVADTAVVQVTAESPDPELSAQAANEAGQVGIERMTGLFPVYNLVFLSRATAPATPYRPDPVRNYSIGAIIGLILATVVAYATDTAARKSAGVARTTPIEAPSSKGEPTARRTFGWLPARKAKDAPAPLNPPQIPGLAPVLAPESGLSPLADQSPKRSAPLFQPANPVAEDLQVDPFVTEALPPKQTEEPRPLLGLFARRSSSKAPRGKGGDKSTDAEESSTRERLARYA